MTPMFKPEKPPPRRRAHNSTLAAPRERISPISERQRNVENDYVEQKRLVHERSDRRCEMPADSPAAGKCTVHAKEVHHVRERSLGRDDSLGNLRDLCLSCHRWATEHTVTAKEVFAAHPLA